MNASLRRQAARVLFALTASVLLPWSLLSAQPPEKLPPPAVAPKLAIVLKDRHGHATPERHGVNHTGAGNVDIAQPQADTVVITMTGVAVAGPHPCKNSSAALTFDLNQCFAIVSSDERVKKGKLTLEASIIGLLRGDKHGGGAGVTSGSACVNVSGVTRLGLTLVGVALESHAVTGCENLAINCRKGPVSAPVQPGEYQLLQAFHIDASHVRSVCGKAASAEFAPDPALDPQWISVTEPFHGASKKDFGFRVILRVDAE